MLPSSSAPLSQVTSTSAIGSPVKRELLRCDAVRLGEGLDRQLASGIGGAAAGAVAHTHAPGLEAHDRADLSARSAGDCADTPGAITELTFHSP